jgi:uncharacterized protein (DUF433 family)
MGLQELSFDSVGSCNARRQTGIRGTRLSASLILACLAEGMSAYEIEESYGPFPHEAIPEILKAASELLDSPHVAA